MSNFVFHTADIVFLCATQLLGERFLREVLVWILQYKYAILYIEDIGIKMNYDFKDMMSFGMFILALLTFIYLICH